MDSVDDDTCDRRGRLCISARGEEDEGRIDCRCQCPEVIHWVCQSSQHSKGPVGEHLSKELVSSETDASGSPLSQQSHQDRFVKYHYVLKLMLLSDGDLGRLQVARFGWRWGGVMRMVVPKCWCRGGGGREREKSPWPAAKKQWRFSG